MDIKPVSRRIFVVLTVALLFLAALTFIAQAADDPLQVATGSGAGTNQFGTDIACAGDFNNDGTDDVIVGAPGEDKAYIFLGPVTTLAPGSADTVLTGAASSQFGFSVGTAGTINADAYDDLIGRGQILNKVSEGEGMNPGMTNPRPFSIHMPMTIMIQATIRATGLFRAGVKRMTTAQTFMARAAQIQGAKRLAPCRPKRWLI